MDSIRTKTKKENISKNSLSSKNSSEFFNSQSSRGHHQVSLTELLSTLSMKIDLIIKQLVILFNSDNK